jgi:hypothetical protein
LKQHWKQYLLKQPNKIPTTDKKIPALARKPIIGGIPAIENIASEKHKPRPYSSF